MNTEDRNRWLAERRQGIGGSDVAGILGLSPWATPVTVWLDKTGRSAPKPENEAMRIGTELEDFVARRYSQETGLEVRRFNTMIHKGCMLGNFDRLVVPKDQKIAAYKGEVRTDLLLECKTASIDWPDGVPLYYQTQVQWYMGLAESLQHTDVACLFLNHKHFEVFRVERDQELIDTIQSRCTEWWERHVVHDEMPKPTNEADCKALWARSNPLKQVKMTSEVEEAVERLRQAKSLISRLEDRQQKLEDTIKAAMGDAEALVDLGGKVVCTWKTGKDKVVTDWKLIAKEMNAPEDVIAKNTSTKTGSRLFLLKEKLKA